MLSENGKKFVRAVGKVLHLKDKELEGRTPLDLALKAANKGFTIRWAELSIDDLNTPFHHTPWQGYVSPIKS